MKKKVLLAVAMMGLLFQMSAQEKPFIFGLRLGTSIDWMHPGAETYEGNGVRGGFAWGFIAEYNFSDNYAIQSGFNVQYLGGKLTYPAILEVKSGGDIDTISGNLERTYHLQYLQIPIAFKMQTEVKENFFLYGKLGFGTAFRLKAKADDYMEPVGGSPYEADKKDIRDDISIIRESLIIGGGAKITLKGTTSLIVELNYDSSLFDIMLENNSADPSIEQKGTLNFIELGVGVLF